MKRPWDNELLSAYVDSQLDAAQQAEVEKLLADDPDARRVVSDLRTMSGLFQRLPKHTLGEDLGPAVLAEAERRMLTESTLPTPKRTLRERFLTRRSLTWASLMIIVAVVVGILDDSPRRWTSPIARVEPAAESPPEEPEVAAAGDDVYTVPEMRPVDEPRDKTQDGVVAADGTGPSKSAGSESPELPASAAGTMPMVADAPSDGGFNTTSPADDSSAASPRRDHSGASRLQPGAEVIAEQQTGGASTERTSEPKAYSGMSVDSVEQEELRSADPSGRTLKLGEPCQSNPLRFGPGANAESVAPSAAAAHDTRGGDGAGMRQSGAAGSGGQQGPYRAMGSIADVSPPHDPMSDAIGGMPAPANTRPANPATPAPLAPMPAVLDSPAQPAVETPSTGEKHPMESIESPLDSGTRGHGESGPRTIQPNAFGAGGASPGPAALPRAPRPTEPNSTVPADPGVADPIVTNRPESVPATLAATVDHDAAKAKIAKLSAQGDMIWECETVDHDAALKALGLALRKAQKDGPALAVNRLAESRYKYANGYKQTRESEGEDEAADRENAVRSPGQGGDSFADGAADRTEVQLKKREGEVVDVILVEASPEQLQAMVAALDQHPDVFRRVFVEPMSTTLAKELDLKGLETRRRAAHMMQSLPEASKPEAEALSASEPTAEAPRQPLTTPAEPMAEAIEEAAADPAATPVEQPAAEPAVDAPDGADFAPMEAPMEPLLEESQPGLITRPAPPRYSPALPPGGEGSAGSKGEAEKGTTEGVDPSSTFAEPPAASRRVLLKLRLVSP